MVGRCPRLYAVARRLRLGGSISIVVYFVRLWEADGRLFFVGCVAAGSPVL